MEKPTKLFNRNYLLQWQAQSVSRIGTQAYSIAMSLWILQAFDSATLMGVLGMLGSLPGVLLGPVGGVIADRYSRRTLIIFSDLTRGLAVLSLTAMLFLFPEHRQFILVWMFAITVYNSVVGTIFNPAIQAAIPDMVPEDKVGAANSMGQLSQQLSTFLGTGFSGTLVRVLGAPFVFLLNALSFLYAAGSEVFVTIPQHIPDRDKNLSSQFHVFLEDIREGLRYVWRQPGLREVVFTSAFITFFSAPIMILLPIYVADVLNAPPDWIGYLSVASGIGALVAYLTPAFLHISGAARGRLTIFFVIIESIGYGLLGFVTSPWVAAALGVIGGFALGYITLTITTIVQVTTPTEIRGRVFGVLSTISASLTPVAMGLAGVIADLLNQNIPVIYIGCGAIMTLLSVLVAFNKPFRDYLSYEYRRDGLQSAEPEPVPQG